jgi:hypothetical protein
MSLYSKQYSSITGAVECASLAKCFRIFRSLVHCYTSILEFLFSDYSIHYTRKVTEEGYKSSLSFVELFSFARSSKVSFVKGHSGCTVTSVIFPNSNNLNSL